ncbi:hypothetical protein M885DRAFT_512172 [Pelagophyceae sp. CCMP2097]|nr:hypothetical protein M885DRAFT_512172 [Pelagophyceae sp. CCMP2097]
MRAAFAVACLAAAGDAFTPPTARGTAARRTVAYMADDKPQVFKAWTKASTLAEQLGSSDSKSKGLGGGVRVDFVTEGEETKTTMAIPGQRMSDVATQADKWIQYGCGKGECGTCECRVDGNWVKMCQQVVPSLAKGEVYTVGVPATKIKGKKSSGFFSMQSFADGFRNNALGVVGLVVEGSKADPEFEARMEKERKMNAAVAARKAAKAAQQ